MSFIRKEWKASYTVEAAFVVPILLSAMLVAMLIGLDLYEDVKGEQEQEKIMQMWQVKQVPDDLLWVLDENHKLRHFNSRVDIVKYFVKYRLTKYNDRKNRLVGILEKKYDENSKLVKFIELVCKGKLKIRNRSKVDIKADMDKENLPITLMQTPMSKVTIEERDELSKLRTFRDGFRHLKFIIFN